MMQRSMIKIYVEKIMNELHLKDVLTFFQASCRYGNTYIIFTYIS